MDRHLEWTQENNRKFSKWVSQCQKNRDLSSSQDCLVVQAEMLLLGLQHPQQLLELQALCKLQELQEFEKCQQAVLNPLLSNSNPPLTPVFNKYTDEHQASNKHAKIESKFNGKNPQYGKRKKY